MTDIERMSSSYKKYFRIEITEKRVGPIRHVLHCNDLYACIFHGRFGIPIDWELGARKVSGYVDRPSLPETNAFVEVRVHRILILTSRRQS